MLDRRRPNNILSWKYGSLVFITLGGQKILYTSRTPLLTMR